MQSNAWRPGGSVSRCLDINALRTLREIVRAGGFRKAADCLNITQSAASQHIRKLERAIRKPIFVDPKHSLKLTEAGSELLQYGEKILRLNDEAIDRFVPCRGHSIRFSLGVSEQLAPGLPALLSRLQQERPQALMTVHTGLSEPMRARVHSGELDAALLLSPLRDTLSRPLGAVELAWFGNPRLLPDASLPIVIFTEPCNLREHVRGFLESRQIPYRITSEAADLASLVGAVNAGLGSTSLIANADQLWDIAPKGGSPTVAAPPPIGLCLTVNPRCSVRFSEILEAACRQMLTSFPLIS